jgi:hypothetical protein
VIVDGGAIELGAPTWYTVRREPPVTVIGAAAARAAPDRLNKAAAKAM